ncbi:MAG TPA: VWA domain-containing protein [Trebonia sp.]
MSFTDPLLLAGALLAVALLAWAAAVAGRRRTAALARLGAAPPGGKRPAAVWLTIAGLAVLAVAAAGPAVSVPVSHARGTVILAVDVSGSMSATDVAPSRLAAAKQTATSFVNAQPDTVEIGVVSFEQGGLETAVPSVDHASSLAAVSRLTPGGGTSLGAAILAALSAITHRTVTAGANGAAPAIGYWPSATIVLFSDGQDEDDAGAAAAVAQKAGVHVDTVGIGTAAGTTVDADGYHLFTALDAARLKSISQATGGSYHPASDAGELNRIASSINLRLTVTNQPLPLAGAFILLALLLLAAGAAAAVARTGRVI